MFWTDQQLNTVKKIWVAVIIALTLFQIGFGFWLGGLL